MQATDADLVRRVRAGQTEAFGELVRMYQKNADEIRCFAAGRMPPFVTGGRGLGDGPPVFCYHDVPADRFEAQLQQLRDGSYGTLDCEGLDRRHAAPDPDTSGLRGADFPAQLLCRDPLLQPDPNGCPSPPSSCRRAPRSWVGRARPPAWPLLAPVAPRPHPTGSRRSPEPARIYPPINGGDEARRLFACSSTSHYSEYFLHQAKPAPIPKSPSPPLSTTPPRACS